MPEPHSQLTDLERERYDRQLGRRRAQRRRPVAIKEFYCADHSSGRDGRPRIVDADDGCVGRVIIAHGGDMISPDLNRQVLGNEAVLGQPRAPDFGNYLRSMNRFVEVEAIGSEPNDEEARELAQRCDIILACPPTFEERLRLNRVSVEAGIPFIDAAQWGMTGTLIVCRPGETACLQCVYPTPPPFEEFFPVVGAISSAIGSLAALEAVKILSGTGKPMWNKMYTYDGYQGRTTTVDLTRNPDCPCCGQL